MADLPPPPENPFESNDYDAPHIENNGGDQELPQGAPNVAAKAGKAFVVIGVVLALVLLLLYVIFSGKKNDVEKPPVKKVNVTAKPYEPPPPLPVEKPTIIPPATFNPPPIPQPVLVPDVNNINPLRPQQDNAAKAQASARMRSNMMLKDGGDGGSGLSSLVGGSTKPATPTDPNSAWANSISTSRVEQVQATHLGDLRRTIAQGRIIQATTESAINTDLPAPLRAIVSRDCFGESGTTPLIPKGSRLIGQYNTSVSNGQNRVFIVWTRVIRPDGVDVMLNSPAVDGIGQAGVSGQLDTKFQQLFARSLMSSLINIGVGMGSDAITGGTTTTTNAAQGGSQTSGDAATTATTNALNRLGSVTDSFIQRFINVPPTIVVDQGTVINVFVNKDVIFPSDLAGTRVIN